MKLSGLFQALAPQTPQTMVSSMLFDPQVDALVRYSAEKNNTGKYDILKTSLTNEHFAHSLELIHGAASWTPSLPVALAVKILGDFEAAVLKRGGHVVERKHLDPSMRNVENDSHFSRYSHFKALLPVYRAKVAIHKMSERLGL